MKSAPWLRVHNKVTGKRERDSSLLCRTTDTRHKKNSVDILAARASDDRLQSNEETVEHQPCNTTERRVLCKLGAEYVVRDNKIRWQHCGHRNKETTDGRDGGIAR
jgi:hypothetical protein